MAKPKFTIPPVKASAAVAGVDKEILTKTVDDGVYPLAMAKEIRLDRIQPDAEQPRRSWDEERLQELAASIREQGVLQPIVVEYVDQGNFFKIVHGERRWRAAKLAGLEAIPAIIRKVDDNTRLIRQLIENIQREDLNDVDRARALKQLKVNLGSPSWEVIAQKVGITKRRILQLVDITKLPESVQEDIRSGQLTEKHGRAIKIVPEEKQIEFAKSVRSTQLSGDESLEAARVLKSEPRKTVGEAVAEVKERKLQRQERSTPQKQVAPKAEESREEGVPQPEGGQRGPQHDPLAHLAPIPDLIRNTDLTAADPRKARIALRLIILTAVQTLMRIK